MCQFFSFVTKGSKKYYFNWEQRQQLLSDNPKYYKPDSHTSICAFNNLNDDKVNKYEFNPLTKKFTVDQINIKNNRALAKKWVEGLDFKTVIEPLIIKPIVHPFKDVPMVTEVTDNYIHLLKQWASVWASVWAYMSSFFNIPKWEHIDHEQGINPFQSCIDLWDQGLVPSFDGTTWRLHSGPDAKIVYELKIK